MDLDNACANERFVEKIASLDDWGRRTSCHCFFFWGGRWPSLCAHLWASHPSVLVKMTFRYHKMVWCPVVWYFWSLYLMLMIMAWKDLVEEWSPWNMYEKVCKFCNISYHLLDFFSGYPTRGDVTLMAQKANVKGQKMMVLVLFLIWVNDFNS